jgi:thioredoxin reductase (NADPH)
VGKPDCHLCHVMEEAVAPVLAARGIRLVVRDVREDRELLRRYRHEIPVLLEGDVELARHRVTPEDLVARLAALGGPSD